MDTHEPPLESSWCDFAQLLAAAGRRERAAQDELFRRFLPVVEDIARRVLRGCRSSRSLSVETGDLVQESLRSVLDSLYSFVGTSEEDFVGYLRAVARNRLIDQIRFHEACRRDVRRVSPLLDQRDPTVHGPGPATQAMSAEEAALFQDALTDLTARERALVHGRLEGDGPFKDLASSLAYPSGGAARKAYYAAQARLLLALQRRGIDAR